MGRRARVLQQVLPPSSGEPHHPASSSMPEERAEGAVAAGVVVPRWEGLPSCFEPARVPARNPHFIFNGQVLAHLQTALLMSFAVLVIGDAGIGKTALVEGLAHLAGAPLVRIQGHGHLLAHDLLGIRILRNGTTVFEEGPFALAYRNGWWVLIDELTAIPPGTLQALHAALDGAALTLPDGNVIVRGRGLHVFGTSNTAGAAAERRHHYAGNFAMNDATLGRFVVIRPPALSIPEVTTLLLRWACTSTRPSIAGTASQLATFYARARHAAFAEQSDGVPCVAYALTLRDLEALWKVYLHPVTLSQGRTRWRTVREAADATIVHRFADRDAKLVLEMLRTDVAEVSR
ncbi:MAG: AAA family ATPase [Deltaproteobacteria bacterium]|nr:AAA family ATPase [Deltaproteobacteria bacterium]